MNQQADYLIRLVQHSSASSKRAGVNDLLRAIALRFEADGAILWRETPGSCLERHPPSGRLFVLGAWFAGDEKCSLYDLPLQSATGAAVLDGYPSVIVDISDPLVYKKDGYLRRADISNFCSIPLRYVDGKKGALNLYFKIPGTLTEERLYQLGEITAFIPPLYNTLISNVRWSLVASVNNTLQEALTSEEPHGWTAFQAVAQSICDTVASVFDAIEVTIFLANPLHDPGVYRAIATTWPPDLPFRKNVLRASKDEGLTGWVLAKEQPLLIFDLADFPARQAEYQTTYSNIKWSDSLDICASLRKILKTHDLPPITFMASPITGKGPITKKREVLGVMRCCTAKSSPYYFGEMELSLLSFVADQIGATWAAWLTQQQLGDENAAWQRFVDRIADLNEFVEREVRKERSDEQSIYQKALEVTTDVVARDVISDVRRLNEKRTHLYFYAMHGEQWKHGAPDEVGARQSRRFSVQERPPTSAGARVVQTRKTYSVRDISAKGIAYSPTFEIGRWLTVAPISVAGEIFGVLDIRGVGNKPFPPQAEPIATLLAQQLGLYHYLVRTIAELRRQPLALAQSYQDFSHQLRSPILQVHARAQECARLGATSLSTEFQKELLALRGLAGKARSVSQSLSIFAELAQGGVLKVAKSAIDSTLVKVLIEMADDSQLISDPDRNLRFFVRRAGFDELDAVNAELDKDLFLQAVGNLLDNASKYSYENTEVEISASITKTGRFRVSIKNIGIPLRGSAIEECKDRGWRAEEAQAVTGEGSGLGLWIVDHIMKAHDGELVVEATNKKGETNVVLLFPIAN
jgi:signal transduction histidine kinase